MYREKLISGSGLMEFSDIIPVNYRDQIKRGEMRAVAVYDECGESSSFYGLYATARHNNWLEIVQLYLENEKEAEVSRRADFIRYVIRRERGRNGKNLKGAFFEVHEDEITDDFRQVVAMARMDLRAEKSNVFEFTLAEVGQRATFKAIMNRLECRCLFDTTEEERTELHLLMNQDDRAVPVPLFPDWLEYRQDISEICFDKDGIPCGALLFTQERDYLVLELAWNSDKMSLAVMIGNALKTAEEVFPDDKKVLVPVVVSKTDKIVEKMVPTARRSTIYEAVQWF